jgi:hypothetical protein
LQIVQGLPHDKKTRSEINERRYNPVLMDTQIIPQHPPSENRPLISGFWPLKQDIFNAWSYHPGFFYPQYPAVPAYNKQMNMRMQG